MAVQNPTITILNTQDTGFDVALSAMLNRAILGNPEINQVVEGILSDVRERGDAAVLDYTRRFDRFEADSMAGLCVTREQMELSLKRLPLSQAEALKIAAGRVRSYHEKQKQGLLAISGSRRLCIRGRKSPHWTELEFTFPAVKQITPPRC